MSLEVKYEPLAPVYTKTELSDEEIAMSDLSAPPAEQSVPSSACCKDSGCKKRSLGARVCRCIAVTVMVGAFLWFLTGVAFVSYMGAKAHRCLHPRHQAVREFSWSPADVNTLELGLVAGSFTVRSCPYAKNISLTVRTYASSPDLLSTMLLEQLPLKDPNAKGHHLVLSAPSFDWTHCQRAAMEIVVPEGANLDLKAQGIVSHTSVRADRNALRHVVLSSTVGIIDLKRAHITGTLRVDAELAHVDLQDVSALQGVVSDVRIGYVKARKLEAPASSISNTLRVGKASYNHVNAKEFQHLSELAIVNAWDVHAITTTARVDTGALSFGASPNFQGTFHVRSPFGFVSMRHSRDASSVVVTKENLAAIEGTVQVDKARLDAHVGAVSTLALDAMYGSVELFVPEPERSPV